MRMVRVPRLDREVSAIGFGCASLGSRISATDGRRAISRALDLGLNWFDAAPPYGDGNAEALLGQALRGQRDKVVICTKVGIDPPQVSLPARLIRPAARKVVAAFPSLRRAVSSARPTGTRAPIDPAAIEDSVTRSLRRLDTDYIDVLAVHEPTPQEAANAEIFHVLRRLVERGIVRAIAVAGEPASIEAAVSGGQPIDIAQFPDTPYMGAAAALRTSLPAPAPMFVTHGVFGSGIIQTLSGMNIERRASIIALAESHGIDFSRSPGDLLLRFAFSNNPGGVVIISMFDISHIEHNIAAASLPPAPALAAMLRENLATG